MTPIYINGKFLSAPLNGVHRTAAHYASGLMARARQAGVPCTLLAPETPAAEPLPDLAATVRPGPLGGGQGWEMLTLPALAADGLLLNFCNLGPLLHRNSVVMIHDAQTYLYPRDYSGLQAAAYRALLPRIGRRARRVLTVSDYSRKCLAAYGISPADKIGVIHNGTDHLRGGAAEQGVLAAWGLVPGSYVMVLGSTKTYKNISRIFAALPEGLRLVVAGGPGPAAYVAKGWSPPGGTVFTGPVSDGALRALYAGAAVFAFPSLTEGFGLPPVEAMHCGAPVVASTEGAMPEVCDCAALYVDPDDTEGWRVALARVATDRGLADDLRQKGAVRAAWLSWEAATDRLWAEVTRLL